MGELTDHEVLLEVHADVKDIKESVSTMRQTLYGNGNESGGLVTKQAVLCGKIDSIAKILTFVGGPLVAAIIIYLVGLLVK